MSRKHKRRSSSSRVEPLLDELAGIVAKAQVAPISAQESAKLTAAIELIGFLRSELQSKTTSIERLKAMVFGAPTEKTERVLGEEASSAHGAPGRQGPAKEARGHGRNGASVYTGAERVKIAHPTIASGDACSQCCKGKVYPLAEPATAVRIGGMAPLSACVYERDRLRCNLCGEVYTAPAPEGVGEAKYDESASSMVGMLKYGAGLPFNRIERLQSGMGIPLPAATQWDLVQASAQQLAPVHEELVRQAAQGELLHNDDTTMKILKLTREQRAAALGSDADEQRTGVFTSGIVAIGEPPAPRRTYNRTHQLDELIAASQAIEEGKRVAAHLLEQLDPGTSMGGARPKATIEDDHCLWLGKFPAKDDRFNLQRVEFATLDLASRCGLNVTQARLQSVGSSDVLMLRRFDREHAEDGYLRFGLVSGLTVLDCGDSHLDRDRWSYPLLAENLRRWSDKPEADCAELFRRMVFNAAVTNNDDHPRNHALLRRQKGWRLSPAYDLVPAPVVSLERRDLALTVGSYGRTASIYNLLSQASRFGLSVEDARQEIDQIVVVVRQWRDSFFACGVSTEDIEYIAPAILPECFFFERRPDT